MDDLINRQAAIDLCDWYDNPSMHDDLEKLPSAQPEQHWIPCSERLPEPRDEMQRRSWFLTTNNYNSVCITCYEFDISPFTTGWQSEFDIIAWMPLPEPYKEERA